MGKILSKIAKSAKKVIALKPYEYPAKEVLYGGRCELFLSNKAGNYIFNLSMKKVENNFCCGIVDLGEFYVQIEESNISNERITEAISNFLNNICNEEERLLMFTLIDNEACNFIKLALQNNNNFQLIREFTNPNSGNINQIYLSTHIK